jgi:His-Xaa-Ser system protein HxsD
MDEIKLNKNLYPFDVVVSACYALMDKAYFIFDEDDRGNIIVRSEAKEPEVGIGFLLKEELLSCLDYHKQTKKNKALRQDILKRALMLDMGEVVENRDNRKG